MYLPWTASKRRLREAENARRNRLEIVKALADGQITRRDLFRWGLFTTTGMLAMKNGLSPFAQSAFAAVPTGTPLSPLYNAVKFSVPMPRMVTPPKYHMRRATDPNSSSYQAVWFDPTNTTRIAGELSAKKYSWHNDYNADPNPATSRYRNRVTRVGPCEGRPDGDYFAHQRWDELFPKYGYLLSIAQSAEGTKLIPSPDAPAQDANAVWCFGHRAPGFRGSVQGSRIGNAVPTLLKMRYGEPCVTRIYNDLPVDRTQNGGFGRNEISTHFHNAHNGAESDGACNAYHFPGTFYDYHWGTTMARRDMSPADIPELTGITGWQRRACGPNDSDGIVRVPGDFREIQGSMWFHDHRFFFTAENVHKGMFAMCNMYSGPDRGREDLRDGVNLQLPSGNKLPWGNTDFDVNIAITNPAMRPDGQMFFDIFDTDGFLGDMLLVNGTYYPFMEVLPRRYRLRTINASMSRFLKLGLVVDSSSRFARGTAVPFHFIANDGNFIVKPLRLTILDVQGVAERYDIVVDFSAFQPGDTVYLVNFLQQTDGRLPSGAVSTAQALAGVANDPAVGPVLKFVIADSVQSVDDPTVTLHSTDPDLSVDLSGAGWGPSGARQLTWQIPIVAPVRERIIEWGRAGGGDSRDPTTGQCIPECGDIAAFPWSVRVNGGAAHSLNANRIGALIPKPHEVEHWTFVNGGGGWDHPIHLHFEEGVTIDRGTAPIPDTERLVRKDVWRLGAGGRVKFQVRFGEFGGAYVNHCHNTVHEDFAMLLRYQLLTPPPGSPDFAGLPHWIPTQTPRPTPEGIRWDNPEVEILPEGDPRTSG